MSSLVVVQVRFCKNVDSAPARVWCMMTEVDSSLTLQHGDIVVFPDLGAQADIHPEDIWVKEFTDWQVVGRRISSHKYKMPIMIEIRVVPAEPSQVALFYVDIRELPEEEEKSPLSSTQD